MANRNQFNPHDDFPALSPFTNNNAGPPAPPSNQQLPPSQQSYAAQAGPILSPHGNGHGPAGAALLSPAEFPNLGSLGAPPGHAAGPAAAQRLVSGAGFLNEADKRVSPPIAWCRRCRRRLGKKKARAVC